MQAAQKTPRIIFIIALLALGLRVAVIFLLPDYKAPASWEYGAIAANLAAGKGFSGGAWFVREAPTAFMAPLYPAVIAAFMRAGLRYPYLGVQLFQALAFSLAVVVFYRLWRLLFWERAAVIAAGLLAVYPLSVYSVRLILSPPLAFCLLVAALYFLCCSFIRERRSDAPLAGFFYRRGAASGTHAAFRIAGRHRLPSVSGEARKGKCGMRNAEWGIK